MNELIILNSILRYYGSNFLNIHWNCSGIDFDDSHNDISAQYYELCNSYIDSTAEMIARLDGFPLNYSEVSELASCMGWQSIPSEHLYSREDVVAASQSMLASILKCISDCLDSQDLELTSNAGIRSEIEAIQEAFDLQVRYINKRRGL